MAFGQSVAWGQHAIGILLATFVFLARRMMPRD